MENCRRDRGEGERAGRWEEEGGYRHAASIIRRYLEVHKHTCSLVLHTGSASIKPEVLVTCCPSTTVSHVTARSKSFQHDRSRKKPPTLRTGPFGPPVLPYCATGCKNKLETGTLHRSLQPFGCCALLLVFHLKPLKPDMQNRHFSVFATSEKRKENPNVADAGRRHLLALAAVEGPVEGFRFASHNAAL